MDTSEMGSQPAAEPLPAAAPSPEGSPATDSGSGGLRADSEAEIPLEALREELIVKRPAEGDGSPAATASDSGGSAPPLPPGDSQQSTAAAASAAISAPLPVTDGIPAETDNIGASGGQDAVAGSSGINAAASGAPSSDAAQFASSADAATATPPAMLSYQLEGLIDDESDDEAAIDAALEAAFGKDAAGALQASAAAETGSSQAEAGPSSSGRVGGVGVGGGLFGSLLGNLRAAASGAAGTVAGQTEKLQEALGKHVYVGQRSGIDAKRIAEMRQSQIDHGTKKVKKSSTRALKRAEKKRLESLQQQDAIKEQRKQREQDEKDVKQIVTDNMEAFAEVLQRFADACRSGDRGQVHLLLSNIFSETNQIVMGARGLPQLKGMPWKLKTMADFFDACFALSISTTGNVELVNEIEKLTKELESPMQLASLVSAAAADPESWRRTFGGETTLDPEVMAAKRAVIHEWIEKGYLDVLSKALSLVPLCIQAPEEPPLVTALRAGHSKQLISLLVEPCVRRRRDGVDEASAADGATAVGLALQNNRMDVLGQILKASSSLSMSVGGKAWTPLCYALAQGRASMVGLLLAHAKKNKPDAAELAEYMNELCEGVTALHRAVAADAPDMVRLLLESGADPAVRTREGGKNTSALHLAAQRGQQPLLGLMLSYLPADRRPTVLNGLVDQGGHSLLHVAVRRHDVPLAQLLLGMGARPTSQSESRSPLLRLLEQLLKQQQAQAQDQQPGAAQAAPAAAAAEAEAVPSDVQSEAGDAEQAGDAAAVVQDQLQQLLAAFLQHWQPVDTAKALHPSQKAADAAALRQWLLQERAHTLDPLLVDPQQRRELGQAAVNERNKPLLELLLEQQPAFNSQGLYLHRLVDRVRGTELELTQCLLDAGASVHEREPQQGTPLLHKAAEENDLACLELLLARGADVEACDDQGNNVLHAVAGQKEKVGVSYTAVVAALYERAPQLVTRRNREFFLPSDRAPAGSAADAQLEALTKRQLDAAKVAEEAERWGRASRDLSLLGPPNEEPERKRQRIHSMLSAKLATTVQGIQRQEKLGLGGSGGDGSAAAASTIPSARRSASGVVPAEPALAALPGPATPDAASIYRQRPRKRSWADLADELPVTVRMPVWPESLEAAAAAARADPKAAVAQILHQATPEGAPPVSSLSELPWEMDIHKDAWAEWMAMEARHRRMVLQLLLRIAGGRFESLEYCRRVSSGSGAGELTGIEVWYAKLPKSACLIFEVAPEVDVRRSIIADRATGCERDMQYHDIVRIWFVSLDEGRAREALDVISASYRKGQSARRQLLLEPQRRSSSAGAAQEARLPLDYSSQEVNRAAAAEASAAAEAEAGGGSGGGRRMRRYFPPASTEADSYTVLKFHPLEDSMLHAVMTNEGQTDVDFKFRLSPEETEIIERHPNPPQSLILLGRSGTGKTTCAVFRMFEHWRQEFEQGAPLHQVFVTVSATLKEQVAKAFVRLRNGLPAVTPDRAAAYAAASAQQYHSFQGLPEEAWPLFLSSKQYLHMLDGTLRVPFFRRRANGAFYFESEAKDDDDGMSMLVDLAGAPGEGAAAGRQQMPVAAAAAAEEGARIKITFSQFQGSMFRRLLNQLTAEERKKVDFTAGLAWQEIVSYIKGTKMAVESGGRLSQEQYRENIGRKQAPHFGPDSRRLIYQLFLEYEAEKKKAVHEDGVTHYPYDAADFVAYMHRQLKEGGYRGESIDELYCDEVQDFTQAELLLALRVVSNPNGIFLCGDTCQTIARGIGFRFTDVRQLFWEAQNDAKRQRGKDAAPVQQPDVVPLEINYRTHSGVLDVAASVVQLLKRFFADHIDNLAPEQAFLEAPHLPLLLPAATPGNVAMLLSGGDANEAWKTEFGANQVVLRRTLSSAVPPFLAKIDAVIMTIPQAKGLEFNDVFILNFFADSPCKEEWRVLLQYLAELEEKQKKHGHEELPFQKPLADVSPGDLGVAGARLDALHFDESQHKLLCEELKHLYTAVTRAKNAVVFFDSDPQAHAPFYFYLARLGLARVVTGALQLEEGKDLHQLGLSKSKSTPADWIRRAQTMVRTKNFDAAATCFRKAGNSSRAQACQAQAKLQAAAQLDEEQQGQQVEQQRALRFDAGYTLLATAVNASSGEADASERREWLLLAAAALKAAGEEAAAQQLTAVLGPLAAAAGGGGGGGLVRPAAKA